MPITPYIQLKAFFRITRKTTANKISVAPSFHNRMKLELYFNIFLGLFIPFLSIYYLMNRKVRKLPFDKHIILALLILFVSDLLELSFFKEFEIKDKIQISLHLIIQFLFLIVFRKEGAILVQESKIDVLKIFIPAGLVFLIF